MDSSAVTGAIALVVNPGAGSGTVTECLTRIEAVLREHRRPLRVFKATPGESLEQACRRAAAFAQAEGGALAIAGGDGSINTAAQVARDHDVALGIIPAGTFNYFARLHKIPLETEPAAGVIGAGHCRTVAVGEVNGQLFLNNASFGLYTRLIQRRERDKSRFGRSRPVALLSAALALLQGQRPFNIKLASDGATGVERTAMVFVANNPLQLEAFGLLSSNCVDNGALGVLLLKSTSLWGRLRLALRTALRELEEDERLLSFCSTELEVRSDRRRIETVIDGEIRHLQAPLMFRAQAEGLRLLVPAP